MRFPCRQQLPLRPPGGTPREPIQTEEWITSELSRVQRLIPPRSPMVTRARTASGLSKEILPASSSEPGVEFRDGSRPHPAWVPLRQGLLSARRRAAVLRSTVRGIRARALFTNSSRPTTSTSRLSGKSDSSTATGSGEGLPMPPWHGTWIVGFSNQALPASPALGVEPSFSSRLVASAGGYVHRVEPNVPRFSPSCSSTEFWRTCLMLHGCSRFPKCSGPTFSTIVSFWEILQY